MPPTLTGRTRHRIQTSCFGPDLLVLQVEEKGERYKARRQGPYLVEYTYYRDARVEDLAIPIQPTTTKE